MLAFETTYFRVPVPVVTLALMPIASGRSFRNPPTFTFTHLTVVSGHAQPGRYNGLIVKDMREDCVTMRSPVPRHFESNVGALAHGSEHELIEQLLSAHMHFGERQARNVLVNRLAHTMVSGDTYRIIDDGVQAFVVNIVPPARAPVTQTSGGGGGDGGESGGCDWTVPMVVPDFGELPVEATVIEEDGDDDAADLEEVIGDGSNAALLAYRNALEKDRGGVSDDDLDVVLGAASESDGDDEDDVQLPPPPHDMATIRVWAARIQCSRSMEEHLPVKLDDRWHVFHCGVDIGHLWMMGGNSLQGICSRHPSRNGKPCKVTLFWPGDHLDMYVTHLMKWLLSGTALSAEEHWQHRDALMKLHTRRND